MTSKEARSFVCRPGYWLKDVSELGETPNWQEVVEPQRDSGKLFGYDAKEFMAKQYVVNRR